MSNCSNCIEIDGHTFGLYSIVGFENHNSVPLIEGVWNGVVYILPKKESLAIQETVMVGSDLMNHLLDAFLLRTPLLLGIEEIHQVDDCSCKVITSILPYYSPIISKTLKQA